MKIKKDPVIAAKRDIESILRNHEWLFKIEVTSPDLEGWSGYFIDYKLLAELVYDIKQGRTFGRGAIN